MCICQVASDINISGVFSDAQVVTSGRRPRPSQALADWYAIATVPVPEPKALPERRNSYCIVTPAPLENTDEHDVAPDRVPGPWALSGRTRETEGRNSCRDARATGEHR